MNLSYRTARIDDFDVCLSILREGFAFDDNARRQLPDIWQRLFRAGQMIFVVVEDADRPPEARIVGYGASVFVSDAFLGQLKDDPVPYLGARVIDKIGQNDSPVFSLPQIRAANSGDGLNLLVLHHSWAAEHLTQAEVPFVRAQIVQSFLEYHMGYNLREIISEVIGEAEYKWVLAGGAFRLRSCYETFYESHPLPPPELRPCLIGLIRAEAFAGDTTLSSLFFYTKPRFYFTSAEQELLEQFLLGKTDEELAAILNVSVSAVKKRWASIYQKAAKTNVDLLPVADFAGRQKRGAQKRHLLLGYLRHHPEELRPTVQPQS